MLFDRLHRRGNRHSSGHSDGATLQLTWLAKSALAQLHGPHGLGDSDFSERTVPSLSFSLLDAVKPGTTKKEGGKAGALSLLRTQPLPLAPTRPALCKRTFSPHHSPSAAGGPRRLAQLGAW